MKYEDLIKNNPVLDVVQSYYPLIKFGSIYKSTCPFCNVADLEGVKKNDLETFFVNPRTNVWWCGLCWQAGSSIDFVRMIEPCSFEEALELLERRIETIRRNK